MGVPEDTIKVAVTEAIPLMTLQICSIIKTHLRL